MASTVSRGTYYRGKTKKHYESLGYTVQLTEFMTTLFFGGKKIFKKIDIFGSDMIAMNGKEIIFINSKHAIGEKSYKEVIRQGKKEFERFPFPPNVSLHLAVWQLRKPVEIVVCG